MTKNLGLLAKRNPCSRKSSELNKVFLNEMPLKKLANQTNGIFKFWDSREEIINMIDKSLTKLK